MKYQAENLSGIEVAEGVRKDFRLSETELECDLQDIDDLKRRLKQMINEWLDRDFERLLHAMYRLDINEDQFKNVITDHKGTDIGGILADMVIDRECQKVITRRKYRDSG